MKKRLLLAFPLSVLTLAACGQKTSTLPGNQNPPGSKLYTKLGLIQAISGIPNQGVLARFNTISPVTLPEMQDTSKLDTCQLGEPSKAFSQLYNPVTKFLSVSLNAGDMLTFKKGGMTFADMPLMEKQTQAQPIYSYQNIGLVLSGLSNLTVSIPGVTGSFPAFTDVPFRVATPTFSLMGSTDLAAITPTTVFTWTGASNDPLAMVFFNFIAKGSSVFFCTARDDGSFTIPSDFQAVLKAQNFTKGSATLIQSLTHLDTSGDALLVTQSLSVLGDF